MFRKFHLFDFPKDNTYILLADDLRQELFILACEVAGSQNKLAKRLDTTRQTVTRWLKGTICMPLWALERILWLIPFRRRPTIEQIERQVIKYQARGGNPVRNPNLPLIEDERLLRIFFHLAGDGYAGRFACGVPHYYNTSATLRKEFVKDLKVFGDTPVNLQESGARIRFPMIIGYLMKHIYHTSFLSHEVRLHREFWDMDPIVIAQGVRALADDEGTVYPYRVRISSSNRMFLEDVFRLLKEKFPKLSEHVDVRDGGGSYHIIIHSSGINLFAQTIGFTHPKKHARLKSLLNPACKTLTDHVF